MITFGVNRKACAEALNGILGVAGTTSLPSLSALPLPVTGIIVDYAYGWHLVRDPDNLRLLPRNGFLCRDGSFMNVSDVCPWEEGRYLEAVAVGSDTFYEGRHAWRTTISWPETGRSYRCFIGVRSRPVAGCVPFYCAAEVYCYAPSVPLTPEGKRHCLDKAMVLETLVDIERGEFRTVKRGCREAYERRFVKRAPMLPFFSVYYRGTRVRVEIIHPDRVGHFCDSRI